MWPSVEFQVTGSGSELLACLESNQQSLVGWGRGIWIKRSHSEVLREDDMT